MEPIGVAVRPNQSMEPMQLLIDAPPSVPQGASGGLAAKVLPVVSLVAMLGVMAVYFSSGGSRGPATMVFPAMMVVSVLGTVAYGIRGGGHAAELDRNRREYLCYLDGLDVVVGNTAAAQADERHQTHPDPAELWTVAATAPQRDPAHPAFCEIRVGVGECPLQPQLVAAQASGTPDPVTVSALRRLLRTRAVVHDVPVGVALSDLPMLPVTGEPAAVRALLRAMLCQAATFHAPADLRIVAVVGPAEAQQWEWLKWLPHHGHPVRRDAGGPARMTMSSVGGFELDGLATHVLVLVDGAEPPPPAAGRTVLRIGPATGNGDALAVTAGHVRYRDSFARVDGLTGAQALACAREVARHRRAGAPRRAGSDWLALIEQTDGGALTVPIGQSERGEPVMLDLKEAAHGGMGPHGLCIGATGSGKSEFLRTLVFGLIATHPPEALNLVLVDFKGGATFLGLGSVRHVSALITNLADEAAMVARMADALAGEITRRQELLRAAGNIAGIAEYRRVRPDLPPLPTLLIVVDEFSELLYQHPDFAELFVTIGRLGRSLGVHLLLASQRLDEGRLRGLETHLSYRICLKTFSPAESRAVLGIPDAYELPNTPGVAYLKTPTGELTRFQTAFVSGPRPRVQAVVEAPTSGIAAFRAAWNAADHPVSQRDTETVSDTVLTRVAGHGTPAHQIWLPPLPQAVPLSDVLLERAEPLALAVGLVDCPFQQRRDRLIVSLAGAQGNVAIVGGPQSGKSTTARTVITALAATHRPGEVSVYCLDFGGGALGALRALPHVGAVAGRLDVDLIRRTIAELEKVMRDREQRFRELGIDSMADFRRRCAAGSCDPDGYGDIFLVVDGWAALRQSFEPAEMAISAIAAQGLSYGVHVVLTASRWAEFRPAVKDQLGTRIELRLGEPAESEMDRKRARQLGVCPPGRGVSVEGREFLVALPRLDGSTDPTTIPAALAAIGQTLRAQHPDAVAPAVRMLPARVTLSGVARPRPALQVPIGLGERELAPVLVDFGEQPDLVVLGEQGCGKSTALRAICRELAAANDATAVQLFVVDFRRSLLGAVESDHLAGYVISTGLLDAALPAVVERLRSRLPGASVTQRQLRDRSWWSGPELYVVVDDYDLVAGAGMNPLAPLAELLPHARDVGLHLVLARHSGGAARAMFDPVLAAMKNLGCAGLMMSASPDEGVLFGGVRSGPLPAGRGILVSRAGEQLIQVAVADGAS